MTRGSYTAAGHSGFSHLKPISLTEEEAKASLKIDGMLAPVIGEYVPYFRARFVQWFDFAHRLNRLGMRVMNDHVSQLNGREIRDPVSLSLRLLARANHAFGAAILLAERGLTIEANSMSRTLYETGFWLGYLAQAPDDAARDFITEEMKSQLGRDKAAREAMAHEPRAVKELEAQIRQTEQAKAGRSPVPQLSDIAARGECRDYNAYYKVLCGVSGHPTLSSTHGYLSEQDDEGLMALRSVRTQTASPRRSAMPVTHIGSALPITPASLAFSGRWVSGRPIWLS